MAGNNPHSTASVIMTQPLRGSFHAAFTDSLHKSTIQRWAPKSDRGLESMCKRAQTVYRVWNDNKLSIVIYFEPYRMKFSAIDEQSHEGP